jgi:phage FluMu gp28-like protein
MKTLELRPYQIPIFQDNTSGVLLLHWARQIGKSYVLAAWAIYRLLSRPGRLVTVLSNSKENGIEFTQKCREVLALAGAAFEESQSLDLEILVTEIRIRVQGRLSRIKILASNPRTARGFSGDLILDEFAFHQDAQLIWEAAEPILSSNKDFLCRIASTGNGRQNLFYQFVSGGQFPVSRVSRTDAYRVGTKVFHPVTREEVTPEQARAASSDKVAYDQNYELSFAGGGAPLLAADKILKAEDSDCGEVIDGEPSGLALERVSKGHGMKFVGIDIGRSKDLTVATIIELIEHRFHTRAVVRLASMPFKEQLRILTALLLAMKEEHFTGGCIDMTGIGLGLAEDLAERFAGRLTGVHFSNLVPWVDDTPVRITDAMSVNLLGLFEDERISIPADAQLRASLQLPERSGKASGILYTPRSAAGHADDFWSMALATWSARSYETPFAWKAFSPKARARTTGL